MLKPTLILKRQMSNFDDEEDQRFLQLLQEYFLESPPFLLVPAPAPPLHHNPASVSLQVCSHLRYAYWYIFSYIYLPNQRGPNIDHSPNSTSYTNSKFCIFFLCFFYRRFLRTDRTVKPRFLRKFCCIWMKRGTLKT